MLLPKEYTFNQTQRLPPPYWKRYVSTKKIR
jgi:hypothetical protein